MDLLFSVPIKTTAILAMAFLASALLKRQSAAFRSLLWLLAVCGCLIVPILSRLVPLWKVIPAGGLFFVDTSAGAGSFSQAASAYDPLRTIALLWAAGAAIMGGRIAIAYLRVNNVVRRAGKATTLGYSILESPETETPLTCGLLRPRIVLPSTWRNWSADGLKFVLTHEQAHISRRDNMRQFAGHIARAVYWFHPLVWLACSRMKSECERACDDAVLGSGARPSDYASYIVSIAAENPFIPAASLAIAEPSSLESRVRGILDGTRARHQMGRRMMATLLAAAAICLLPVAAVGAGEADGKIYKVSDEGVAAPKKIFTPQPKYSDRAREEKVEGSVILTVVITSKGAVDDVQVEKGLHPDLDLAAVQTISTWRFQPATKDGKPVAVAAHIEVNFRLL